MSLWYDFGGSWAKTSFARNRLGLDVYLCCPGPSLKQVNESDLHVPGAFVVAMTTAFPAISRPDLWIGLDLPGCYDRSLLFQPFPKISKMDNSLINFNGRMYKEYPLTFFADLEEFPPAEILLRRSHDVKFIWDRNTFMFALHFLIWMGAHKIHLVGCDFGGPTDYHDDRVLSEEQRATNKRLHLRLLSILKSLSPRCEESGIKIISCTDKSPANKFLPATYLGVALKQTMDGKDRAEPLLHCKDARLSSWRKCKGGDGVVVLSDKHSEWMIPWWYSRYRQYNDKPVLFVDTGMTPAAVAFCKRHGLYHQLYADTRITKLPGWFSKPFAILSSQFQRTICLDQDCEISGNIDELYELCGDDGLALKRDEIWERVPKYKNKYGNQPCYNGGVIAVGHGHPAIEIWARDLLANSAQYATDQERISFAAEKAGRGFAEIPMSIAKLRLEGEPGGLIYHWTGPVGKKAVAAQCRPMNRILEPLRAFEIWKRLVGKKGVIFGAEVGVFYGRTSSYLLAHLPNLRLFMVDPWRATPEGHRYRDSEDKTALFDQGRMDEICAAATKATDFANIPDQPLRRLIVRKNSLDAAKEIAEGGLYFVFIDADHTYEGCKEDIKAWWPSVKPGGFMAGHDIDNQPEGFTTWGVRKAVEEFMAEQGMDKKELVLGLDFTWFISKPVGECGANGAVGTHTPNRLPPPHEDAHERNEVG